MALNILKNYDLEAMGHNSADYIHVVTEALKLAFADRHHHFGDPKFVKVPIKGLMSDEYATPAPALINAKIALAGMPPAGDPATLTDIAESLDAPAAVGRSAGTRRHVLYVLHRQGWQCVFRARRRDGSNNSPIVPGVGLRLFRARHAIAGPTRRIRARSRRASGRGSRRIPRWRSKTAKC